MGRIPGIGAWVQEAGENAARKNFRLDAEPMEALLRERGELK